MQDLTATLLAHGALLLGYGSLTLAYFLLRKKARNTFPTRPILQLTWWKVVSISLCEALLAGGLAWIIGMAHLFARLTSSMSRICTSHMSHRECADAASRWDNLTILLFYISCLTMGAILTVARGELYRTDTSPEGRYPLVLLSCSHGFLVTSWLLCTPLKHSLELFGLVGQEQWVTASLFIALFAILAYIIGISLWIIAATRVHLAWLRSRQRDRSSREGRGVA